MKTLRVKIIANNCPWPSLGKKVKELQDWFSPSVRLLFDVDHSEFSNVPFGHYTSVDPAQAVLSPLDGIDPVWYDTNISSRAIGFDIVLFVLSMSQWPIKNKARGWRANNTYGAIELQIGCDEYEKLTWAKFPRMSAFFQLARHEICHALYMMTGQKDRTHEFWDQGQIDKALTDIDFSSNRDENWAISALYTAISYLKSLISKQMDTPSQKLLRAAKLALNTDASPRDLASDEFGCAESVSTLLNGIDPRVPIITGTWTLGDFFRKSPLFQLVVGEPKPGDIPICMTGTGNGSMPGHVGVLGEDGVIYSSSSKPENKGKFLANFSVDSWYNKYVIEGGFKTDFFRKIA